MGRPSISARFILDRRRWRGVELRRLTDADAEWLVGDRDGAPGLLTRLRSLLRR